MATARLMETWAHGQDIADALGIEREPTARLRHVAHIGVRTVGFAFAAHGLAAPDVPFRVELTGPHGESWTWGPEDSPTGSPRRHWTSAISSPGGGTGTTSI